MQGLGAADTPSENRSDSLCIGNPGAVEVRLPLAGGGEAPVCVNAPQAEFIVQRQRKPKQRSVIEILEQSCGIRFAAQYPNNTEEDQSSNSGVSSTPPTLKDSTMKQQDRWIEIWIDSASYEDFIYVLILRTRTDGLIEVIDPQKQGTVINTFKSYQEATSWLNEDEYDLVEGRWVIEIY